MPSRRPAIFFDIDGVLNQDPGAQGVVRPEDLVLVPGAGRAIAAAKGAGFIAVGITNRAGVAHGRITLAELDRILERLQSLLAADGAALDKIYFCPHHPEGTVPEFAIRCECRKPGTQLYRRAIVELAIDPARSAAIGDSLRDIEAAQTLGIRAFGVRTGHGCADTARSAAQVQPERIFDDVAAAIDFVVKEQPRPRLLYVVSEDWYFLSHRLPMARAARAAGFDVQVATNVRDGADAITREGFTLHAVPFVRGRLAPLAILGTLRALRQVHRTVAPDIVHRVALQPTVLDALATIGFPSPSVNAITGLGYTFISNTLKARLLRTLIGRVLRHVVDGPAQIALVQNPDDRELVAALGFTRDHIALIPGSGVDTARLQPLPEPAGPFVVGFVGRLLADKGIRVLIAAHRLLRGKGLPVELVVAGTPDAANPGSLTPDEIEAWRHEPGVTLLGFVQDIASVWARAHVAVLPSRREGLPKSLLEAAACGRAMIATDVPGCREVVIPGETGLLVPVDDPPALANAIEQLFTDAAARRQFGAAARELAETRFSAVAVGQATVGLYRKLVDRHPAKATHSG